MSSFPSLNVNIGRLTSKCIHPFHAPSGTIQHEGFGTLLLIIFRDRPFIRTGPHSGQWMPNIIFITRFKWFTFIHLIEWLSEYINNTHTHIYIYIRSTPHPVTVTTRIITFLVGNPYKPSFATVTGWGVDPIYIYIFV